MRAPGMRLADHVLVLLSPSTDLWRSATPCPFSEVSGDTPSRGTFDLTSRW